MTKTITHRFLALLPLLALACLPAIAPAEETDELTDSEKKELLEKKLAAEKEIKAQFEYSFNEVSDKIVTVSCESSKGGSSGSGFVAAMDGKRYLFTNQHVILGANKISFKTATGETLRPRSVELSITRDIARLLLAEGTEGFETSDKTSIDVPIAVFGNSEGGGVATELYGKVTSLSSDVIDVTADIVSGNSGSPVLNQDQEVVAIASYVQWSNKDDNGKKTRHFCYKLTGNQWKPVNWTKYNKKYGKPLIENKELIDSIFEAVDLWYSDPFTRMTADEHPDAGLRKWSTEHNRVINRIMRLNDKGEATQHELDNTNKRIKQDMVDSAEALSEVCRKRARQMRMLAKQRELTAHIHNEFEGLADSLDYVAIQIDRYGKKLGRTNYFSFK